MGINVATFVFFYIFYNHDICIHKNKNINMILNDILIYAIIMIFFYVSNIL